jgi:hypothetical protein
MARKKTSTPFSRDSRAAYRIAGTPSGRPSAALAPGRRRNRPVSMPRGTRLMRSGRTPVQAHHCAIASLVATRRAQAAAARRAATLKTAVVTRSYGLPRATRS